MVDWDAVNVCFHGIGTPRRELEPGEAAYWVGVDTFHAVLDEVADWPRVRISFDDGNASDVDLALPALLERGLTADFFVLAGRLDAPGSLTSASVRELSRHGMTIGNHGMWHRPWRRMSPTTTADELVAARHRLAEAARSTVDRAACPLGRYDRALLIRLRQLGYRRVYTSDRRPARSTAWLQSRYSVRCGDTPDSLRAEVFAPAPLTRARSAAVGLVKRWR
jgi:peptidoglycan/xylan/chitin deacetylase (PgdA/CDA1 family)